jgi:hypothetical protein
MLKEIITTINSDEENCMLKQQMLKHILAYKYMQLSIILCIVEESLLSIQKHNIR